MHTYTESEDGVWTVGFELQAERGLRNFRPLYDCANETEAQALVSYLNGGLPRSLANAMQEYFTNGD